MNSTCKPKTPDSAIDGLSIERNPTLKVLGKLLTALSIMIAYTINQAIPLLEMFKVNDGYHWESGAYSGVR